MIIELSISEENGYFNSKYENDELDIHAFHPSEYERLVEVAGVEPASMPVILNLSGFWWAHRCPPVQ